MIRKTCCVPNIAKYGIQIDLFVFYGTQKLLPQKQKMREYTRLCYAQLGNIAPIPVILCPLHILSYGGCCVLTIHNQEVSLNLIILLQNIVILRA